MAWISSESFYQRLIRSQLHNVAQLELQDSAAFKNMQDEMEALIDERDELRNWKEAHLNERKDSVTRDSEALQVKIRDLEHGLAESLNDCKLLRKGDEALNSTIQGLKDGIRKKESLHKSFEELKTAHEKLKKSNLELETHFAMLTRDLEYQAHACKVSDRSRNELQDQVDEGMSITIAFPSFQ